jgi:methionine salvage enolase-phosphatase E1
LIPVVADVQARIWEMTFHSTNITRDVINDAQIAEAGKASLKQNIDIYKKYQESIEQDKPLK